MKSFLAVLTFLMFVKCSNADWEHMTTGLFANGLTYDFATFDNKIYTTIEYGRFYSTNNGAEWNWADLTNRWCSSLGSNQERLFAGTQETGVIYLTTSSGTNWTQTSFSSGLVRTLEVLGNTILAGFIGGVNISRDNGETWTSTLGGNNVYAIKINNSTNTIFAATFGNGIYKSQDKGFSWTPTGLTGIPVFCLTVQGNKIFAGNNYGLLVSEDNGDSWTYTTLMVGIRTVTSDKDFIFAGGFQTGVYVSSNSGVTWEQRNEGGMGSRTVISLLIAHDYVFAGTEGDGAYRRPLDELLGFHNITNEIPETYSLSQNYPNPFNPETKIRFDIPNINNSSNVKLVIFDDMGKEVTTLTNEQLKPGKYEVNWNASGYASGVYFYKLISGSFIDTKKMILVK
jgi:type IX secretion system substrate protein